MYKVNVPNTFVPYIDRVRLNHQTYLIQMMPCCHRVTESQSHRHPRVLSIRVGEIFLCLISINSPTRFAHRGIMPIVILNVQQWLGIIALQSKKVLSKIQRLSCPMYTWLLN